MIFETDLKKLFIKIPITENYHGRISRRKPHVLAVNKQKHLIFANECVNKSHQFLEKVIFSDESKFCIFGTKLLTLVGRKQGTTFEKQNLVPSIKHGGGYDSGVCSSMWNRLFDS